MERAKQNINGDTLVLNHNSIIYYKKETGRPFRIKSFPSEISAKAEFNRETNSYRGCGKNVWRKRHQAKVFYTQLIIQC